MAKLWPIWILLASALAACQAREPGVVVDMRSSKQEAARGYGQDLYECKKLAALAGSRGNEGMILGLLAGAVIGASTGYAIGGNDYVALGATHGGTVGLTKGGVEDIKAQGRRTETGLDRCMTARGYTVIGVGQLLADQYVPLAFEGGAILAPSIPGSSPIVGYADPDTDDNRRTVAREIAIYEECEDLAITQQFSSGHQWDNCLDQRGSIQPRSAVLEKTQK